MVECALDKEMLAFIFKTVNASIGLSELALKGIEKENQIGECTIEFLLTVRLSCRLTVIYLFGSIFQVVAQQSSF